MAGDRDMAGYRQGGIALVLVLWVIALMTVIALSVSSISRTEVQLVRNRLDEAHTRALSDAAVAYAALRLSAQAPDDLWLPDGMLRSWSFNGRELQVSISNESSRLDLNKSSQEMIRKLVAAAAVEGVDAEAVAAAVLDWRDADDAASPLGAESADYRAAGRPYAVKNAPFHSVEEFGQVLGVTPQLMDLLAPFLTVDSPSSRVMLELADPFVKAALGAEGDEIAAQQLLRRREDSDEPGEEEARQNPQDDQAGTTLLRGGPIYRIRTAPVDGGPAMETLIRLAGSAAGMTVLWQRLDWRGEGRKVAESE
jgi:general secretion pathway protein K